MLFIRFPVLRSFVLSLFSGVVRARNKMQRGAWFVERCFCDNPKVVTSHSGVSYACPLVPVVKHFGAGALGKGD